MKLSANRYHCVGAHCFAECGAKYAEGLLPTFGQVYSAANSNPDCTGHELAREVPPRRGAIKRKSVWCAIYSGLIRAAGTATKWDGDDGL